MKVILNEDVKKVGKKGEVVELADGYARNFIIKKGLGVEATGSHMNDFKLRKQNEEKVAAQNLEDARNLKKDLEQKAVTVTMKAGEGGKVFGSVSSKEIAAAYQSQHGIELDKKKIVQSEPIKNFGTYEVPIKLHPQVTATLTVKVTEE